MNLFCRERIENNKILNSEDHQNLVLSYLNYEYPYRSLIICYKVGSGKTYISACLAHLYISVGFKVLYISNTLNSISNFENECFKVKTDIRNNYKNKIETMTYTGLYRKGCDNKYGLIILDEIHNLRENAIKYNKVKDLLSSFNNSKILITTATPMIDDISELDSIINITNEKDPLILFSDNLINDNIKINYIGEKIGNKTLFLSKMKGKQLQEYKQLVSSKIGDVYTSIRQMSITCNSSYDPLIPLDEQSSKINILMEQLKEDKLTVVFCFYIDKGINFLREVLKYNGYTEFPDITPKKTFAVLTGKTDRNNSNTILDTFNSIANESGDDIKILIGSSVMSESITLFRVRELHILSPFWNYGYTEQSIGRAIRYNSHFGLLESERNINIYLHAAVDENGIGNDINMWNISEEKQRLIDNRLQKEKLKTKLIENSKIYIPEPDNIKVFRINNRIWDFSNCFESNKFKISWCKFDLSKVIEYDEISNTKTYLASTNKFKINLPLDNGYTIWRSCIDNRLRITFANSKDRKKFKRGKLFSNVIQSEVNKISKYLNCDNNKESIIEKLKSQNRYFDKQIESRV